MRSFLIPTTLLCLLTACSSQVEWPEAGVPRSLANERAEGISNLSYELTFDVPEIQDSLLTGRNIVRFDLLKPPQKHLFIDFAGDSIHPLHLKVNGKELKAQYKNDHILIPWGKLEQGSNEIQIDFTSSNQALNRNPDYLFTLFVPDKARTAFPCFDQPDLKARFSLKLNIPASWEAISNAGIVKSEALGEDRKTVLFDSTHPISTYLFSFAVGRFNRVEGVLNGKPAYFYHRESDSLLIAQNAPRLFELHQNALLWLENYTGIPYPFEKFDFVLIPSFQYGGMEHPGDIYYRASRLLLQEDASPAEQLNRASLIAHETAHMWFGDLVTMKWFDDVWLKEVFANFFAAKIVNPEFPEIDHEARFILTHYPRALGVDRSSGSNPIKQDLQNLENAGSLYGDIIYFKAPILMHQLEMLSGAQAFRSGMLTYLHSHKYGNADWEDLVRVLDEITPINLLEWSNTWFFRADLPIYGSTIMRVGKSDTLEIRIFRQGKGVRTSEAKQSFELLLANESSEKSIRCDLNSDTNAFFVEWPAKSSLPVIIMYDGHFYGEQLILADQMEPSFDVALRNPSRKIRGALWVSLHENFLNNRIENRQYFDALLSAIGSEKSPVILSTQLDYMRECWWQFMTAEERISYSAAFESLLLTRSNEPGLGRLFLNAYRDIVISNDGLEQLYSFWADGHPELSLNMQDRITLVGALAVRSHPQIDSIVQVMQSEILDADLRAKFEFLMPVFSGRVQDWEAFLAELRSPSKRKHEAWVLEALEMIHHPLRTEQSVFLLPTCLNMLVEVKRTGDIFFPRSWLDACLSGYQSMDARVIVEEYLSLHPSLPLALRGKVLQAADLLIRATDRKVPIS